MSHTETPTAPPASSSPPACAEPESRSGEGRPDLLTAASMPRVEGITKPAPVEIDDIVTAMRQTLMAGNLAEFETMLAAQAHLMNMAFNRFIMSELRSPHSPNGNGVGIALAAQRGICNTLNTLRRLRTAHSGKGTEGS